MDENRYESGSGTGANEENKVTPEKPVSVEIQNVPPTRDAYGNRYGNGSNQGYHGGASGSGNGYGANGSGLNGGGYGQNGGSYGQFGSSYGQFGGGYGQNSGNYGQFGGNGYGSNGGGYGQNNGYQGGQRNGYHSGWNDKSETDNGFGIAAMILGIISLLLFCSCLNWITGILAIIFAVIQLAKGGHKAYPIVGIITAGVSFILWFFSYFFLGLATVNDPSYRSYPYYYYNSYDNYDNGNYGDYDNGGYDDSDDYDSYDALPESDGAEFL